MNENERIKEVRKSVELTLEKFGERIGITKSALSKIERNENSVSDQVFKAVCREFNVNEEWLRDGTGEMFNQVSSADQVAIMVAKYLPERMKDDRFRKTLEFIAEYEKSMTEEDHAAFDKFYDMASKFFTKE